MTLGVFWFRDFRFVWFEGLGKEQVSNLSKGLADGISSLMIHRDPKFEYVGYQQG